MQSESWMFVLSWERGWEKEKDISSESKVYEMSTTWYVSTMEFHNSGTETHSGSSVDSCNSIHDFQNSQNFRHRIWSAYTFLMQTFILNSLVFSIWSSSAIFSPCIVNDRKFSMRLPMFNSSVCVYDLLLTDYLNI